MFVAEPAVLLLLAGGTWVMVTLTDCSAGFTELSVNSLAFCFIFLLSFRELSLVLLLSEPLAEALAEDLDELKKYFVLDLRGAEARLAPPPLLALLLPLWGSWGLDWVDWFDCCDWRCD